jgi:hypothetical protein
MQLLAHGTGRVIPVGVWKEAGVVHLNFGSPYRLEVPEGLSNDGRDRWVGGHVMRRIAELVPERLRGKYG